MKVYWNKTLVKIWESRFMNKSLLNYAFDYMNLKKKWLKIKKIYISLLNNMNEDNLENKPISTIFIIPKNKLQKYI